VARYLELPFGGDSPVFLDDAVASRGLGMRLLQARGPKYLLMECNYCAAACKKAGRQRNGTQKYQCKGCRKYQQAEYRNKAYAFGMDTRIVACVKEGCGIWNTARLLGISKSTVITKIKAIASTVKAVASFPKDGSYEVDEMHTLLAAKL
jgi:insertion element IS1 protein InsB